MKLNQVGTMHDRMKSCIDPIQAYILCLRSLVASTVPDSFHGGRLGAGSAAARGGGGCRAGALEEPAAASLQGLEVLEMDVLWRRSRGCCCVWACREPLKISHRYLDMFQNNSPNRNCWGSQFILQRVDGQDDSGT